MTQPTVIKRYGWIPGLPDQRDFLYLARPELVEKLPPKMDLRPNCPPVYDQGNLGSCTANMIAGLIEFDQKKQNLPDFVPSRLFIYFFERFLEHTVKTDSGAMIRDGMKVINSYGAPDEKEWPYLISKFATKPPKKAIKDATAHRSIKYQAIQQALTDLKLSISEGFPVGFGFSVYESFESADVAKTGNVPMPGPDETLLGGHAVMAVGYDDAVSRFIVRNSWGDKWGDAGYFTMPYEYLASANLASDFWNLTLTN